MNLEKGAGEKQIVREKRKTVWTGVERCERFREEVLEN